jgi:radical SAM superfamily enzyme YgiQ (UPF0313 family)
MRISLIEPGSCDYHVYSHLAIPRLGLPILGTILRDRGCDVTIYVEDLQPISRADLAAITGSDLVGISCTSATAPRGYQLARMVKAAGVPVVFGGVHPTFLPEEPLKYGDYVIAGQAEEALPLLVEALGSGGTLDGVPGLYYVDDGRIVHNGQAASVPALDDIPIPDFSLIRGSRRMKIKPIMTTRGCPHRCVFCCVSALFGCQYRMMSIERVLAELKQLGKAHVFFCDDNFTASLDRAKELLRQMLRRRIVPARWYAQVRADSYRDPELLDLMQRTNCKRVFVGFESINQEVLDSYNKHLRLHDIRNCIAAFHRHRIPVHGMFMFGADQDDAAACQRTVKFALEQEIDTVQFLILTPVPGSDLFRQMEADGRIFTYDWTLYDGHHVVFEPARMSPLELQLETFRANMAFYSMPSVLRSLSCLRFGTAVFRYMGRRILRGWRRTNARFMRLLRGWQAGRLAFPRRFSLGGSPISLSFPGLPASAAESSPAQWGRGTGLSRRGGTW